MAAATPEQSSREKETTQVRSEAHRPPCERYGDKLYCGTASQGNEKDDTRKACLVQFIRQPEGFTFSKSLVLFSAIGHWTWMENFTQNDKVQIDIFIVLFVCGL